MNLQEVKSFFDVYSVSSFEENYQNFLIEKFKYKCDNIFLDSFNNFCLIKNRPKIALVFHSDCVGFIVREKLDKYNYHVIRIGGAQNFENQLGVVINKEHLIEGKFFKGKHPMSDEEITIFQCKENIEVADLIAYKNNFSVDYNKELIVSNYIDNKIGAVIAYDIIDSINDIALYSTVQEEVDGLGGKVLNKTIDENIELAIIIDITFAEDKYKYEPIKLGLGPAISAKDTLIPNRKIIEYAKNICKEKNIPYQIEVTDFGGSDANNLVGANSKLKTLFVGIPILNNHSYNETCSIKDVNNTISFLKEFILNYDKMK
jgi:endoglucanase